MIIDKGAGLVLKLGEGSKTAMNQDTHLLSKLSTIPNASKFMPEFHMFLYVCFCGRLAIALEPK
jgi:hypothetical protein